MAIALAVGLARMCEWRLSSDFRLWPPRAVHAKPGTLQTRNFGQAKLTSTSCGCKMYSNPRVRAAARWQAAERPEPQVGRCLRHDCRPTIASRCHADGEVDDAPVRRIEQLDIDEPSGEQDRQPPKGPGPPELNGPPSTPSPHCLRHVLCGFSRAATTIQSHPTVRLSRYADRVPQAEKDSP
jgi:hypothetical protein